MTNYLQGVRITNSPSCVVPWLLTTKDGGGHHLQFRKNVNNSILDEDTHQILWEYASQPCGDDHVTKSRNRKLIRVTSSNQCLKDKCVDLSDSNRYLNQIWYGAHMPHYQHTKWPNSHKLKIQDGGCRHLKFRKNVNNSGLNEDICTKFYGKMHHGHAEMTT